jgi:hypothetical protein
VFWGNVSAPTATTAKLARKSGLAVSATSASETEFYKKEAHVCAAMDMAEKIAHLPVRK